MPVLMLFVFGALGIAIGYFLQTTVLIVLSIISIVIATVSFAKAREIEVLLPIIFSIYATVANVAMWITWYVVNDQTVIQDFVKQYILK